VWPALPRPAPLPVCAADPKKLAAHRAEIAEAASRVGWSFLVHHTDRPAAEPLLALTMRLQGLAGDYRWKSDTRTAEGAA
jgi:uncharacterized protein (DUF58 family)